MLGGSILEGLGKVLKGGERAWSRAVELGRASHAREAGIYLERAATESPKLAEMGSVKDSFGYNKDKLSELMADLRKHWDADIGNLRKERAAGTAMRWEDPYGMLKPKFNFDLDDSLSAKARANMVRTKASIGLTGREQISGVVHTPPPKSKAGFGRSGRAATGKQLKSANSMTSDTRFGRGLATMRRHKIKSTLVAGAGLGVAAKVRSTGSGTSRGNTSFYGH